MTSMICPNCEKSNLITSRYCSQCGYALPKIETTVEAEPTPEPKKSIFKRENTLTTIIGMVCFAIAYVVVQQLFFNTSKYDKELMQVASELNKSCPLMMDSETRLDNVLALTGNIFQYNYTLVHVERYMLDTIQLKNAVEPTMVEQVKTSPQMKSFRDHKTTINYTYKDKSGSYLCTIAITPDKYEE